MPVSPELPWVHKKGLELLKANYASQDEARAKIPQQLEAFYRATSRRDGHQGRSVKLAGEGLVTLYSQNVFPSMKLTWGTHPNHIGHMSYPGCFRCHDGEHAAKDGTAITAGLLGLP